MADPQHVHIVGIAGSGMCPVAEVSLASSYRVSGSDRHADRNMTSPILAGLRAAGCRMCPQDGTGIMADTLAVVVSTAIEPDNLDLVAARTLGIPVYHRTEWLSLLIGEKPLLGIAGTSGKSTVTAMVGWILEQNGKDPFVVNGAAVPMWERQDRSGHVRVGSRDLWVLELDESDRSLLRFSPQHAVITNQSADHFPLPQTKALFAAFGSRVQGICVSGPWQMRDYAAGLDGCFFVSKGVVFRLSLPGRHNAENALAATALCECFGMDAQACANALKTFPGVRRRLERCQPSGAIFVFDDFAHNPAKIAAAIDSVLPFTDALTVVWRPHGYGPLRTMLPDLTAVFRRLAAKTKTAGRRHRLLLLPVYDVGGTAARDVQADDLAAGLIPHGVETHCVSSYHAVLAHCDASQVDAGDAVLVMGARDPGLAGLARDVAKQHEKVFQTKKGKKKGA